MIAIRYCCIAWATFPDPNGVNVKTRPVIVLSPDVELARTGVARVVAVSSQVDTGDASRVVELPWTNQPGGNRKTRFRRKSFAVCEWVRTVPIAQLSATAGFLPVNHLLEIQRKVIAIQSARPKPTDPPPKT